MASKELQAKGYTFIQDPMLLREYRLILSQEGNNHLTRSLMAVLVCGVVDGLVYLALLPTATTIITGQPAWGMGTGGWLIALAVLAVIGAVFSYLMNLAAYSAAMEGLKIVLIRVGDKLAQLPLGWFTAGLNGRISRLVTDGVMAVGNGVAHYTMTILRNVIAVIVLLVGVSAWKPVLGVTLLAGLLLVLAFTYVSNRIEKYQQRLTSGPEKELASRIIEYATCQGALRSAGRSADYKPLQRGLQRAHRARFKGLWISSAALMIGGMSSQITVIAVIIVAVQLGLGGTLDPIATVVFIGLALRFMRNINDAVNFLIASETTRTPLADVHEILSAPVLETPEAPAQLTEPGAVALEDVTFSYTPGTPVVRDVSFTVPPKSMTAIVGPSGSGKTTIFKLLARFWDIDSGTVRVGGIDVRSQTTEQLMGQLSMVFQDVYLYDDTLLANIRVGREDATDKQVRRAAELAGCTDIADRLPAGWDTRVGEGGGRLSGGERQRISVARALLKEAPILLFDEATSALDPENEAHIQRSIDSLRDSSTVLVIAHKLDTVRSADQIIVLDEHGSITQVGTHEQLAEREGLYKHFLQARLDASGWSLV